MFFRAAEKFCFIVKGIGYGVAKLIKVSRKPFQRLAGRGRSPVADGTNYLQKNKLTSAKQNKLKIKITLKIISLVNNQSRQQRSELPV